jgi:hypothetical protein
VELIEADDDTARRIVLVDNRTPELAGYDDAALMALLETVNAGDGLAGTGWDQAAVDDLFARAEEEAPADRYGAKASRVVLAASPTRREHT